MRVKTPHQTRIHVSLSLNTIESLFDLAKYRFWSGEAICAFDDKEIASMMRNGQ